MSELKSTNLDLVSLLRMRSPFEDSLCAAAADEIDRARRTGEYWKAEHLAGNAEITRLREAIRQACSDMGCYCADDDPLPENLKCPMCKLEKALELKS